MIPVYCVAFINNVLYNIVFRSVSDLYSPEDSKACLELMFSIGNMLHYTVERMLSDASKSRDIIYEQKLENGAEVSIVHGDHKITHCWDIIFFIDHK